MNKKIKQLIKLFYYFNPSGTIEKSIDLKKSKFVDGLGRNKLTKIKAFYKSNYQDKIKKEEFEIVYLFYGRR